MCKKNHIIFSGSVWNKTKKISAVFNIFIRIWILILLFGRFKLNIIFVNSINFVFSSNRVKFCVKYMIYKFQFRFKKYVYIDF